jgi:hypothetical protein
MLAKPLKVSLRQEVTIASAQLTENAQRSRSKGVGLRAEVLAEAHHDVPYQRCQQGLEEFGVEMVDPKLKCTQCKRELHACPTWELMSLVRATMHIWQLRTTKMWMQTNSFPDLLIIANIAMKAQYQSHA